MRVAPLVLRVDRRDVDARLDAGLEGFSGAIRVALLTPKVPRTFEIIMWRTLKVTSLCDGSSTQVPGR